ncbi:MAG: hypothetical protein EZS28_023914 [Streblomastix strix]|uniref:Uncharacterized protein n=1 Tax=Streblomastix strix TaxID=222440 RepID=A0A5J4VDJ2_9EUKA|nr:MAG: hypothetical protein EZS28_023914 [Streblomastix strix]
MYLRMQEEKEKQQNEIALIKQQLAKQQPKPNTSQPKQQSISTQPKVTSEPKIMIEPPVTQATVTQVRKVLSPVESEVLQDIEVNVGIEDESVRYGRNEWPSDRGWDKIVDYDCSGDIKHIGDQIGGNSEFDNGSRIEMEMNMESNPRSLTFFFDDKEQPNFVINIPKAVRIFCFIYYQGASFKINKFEFLSTPTARHGEGSRAWEYGKEWKK